MNITFTFDSFDFDGTHKVHQVAENIGREISKIIPELLLKVANYQDDHSVHGGVLEIKVRLTGPDLNKEDTIEYNKDLEFYFKVLIGERIEVIHLNTVFANPNHLTKTEISYLKEIIDYIPDKIIAANKNKSIGTARTHRRNIYRKSGCSNPDELKTYTLLYNLLDGSTENFVGDYLNKC